MSDESINKWNQVLFFLPPKNFNDDEFERVKTNLEDLGYYIKIVSSWKKNIEGQHGLKVKPDYSLLELDPASFSALILIGGTEHEKYFDHALVKSLVQTFNFSKKVIACMSEGCSLVAASGILKNRKACAVPEAEDFFREKEILLQDEGVVLDKNIISSRGIHNLEAFIKNLNNLVLKRKKESNKKP